MSSTDHTVSWELGARQRREADQALDELLVKIRAQPGFDNFLHPPTVNELMAITDPDPIIVVNTSSYCCDAFFIERDRIRLLELHVVKKRASDLRSYRSTNSLSLNITPLLEWLWDTVSRPCLEAL